MAKKKDQSVTVKMSRSMKSIQSDLLKFEKQEKRKAKKNKANGDYDMAWVNGYVSGAQFVLSHIEGYGL